MATVHHVLAKVQAEGIAKIFYAHPAIQKTSLILNNKAIINSEVGSIVKLSIKMMPSGKRILLGSKKSSYASIQDFINEVTESSMVRSSEREGSDGKWKVVTKFDGEQDASYLVTHKVLPRFGEGKAFKTENIVEAEEVEDDGFTTIGELFVPEIITRSLNAIHKVSSIMGAANTLVIGPSGNGKTTLAKMFAREHSMDFLKVNCSVIRDPEEWFGYREAKDGSTIFVPTEFTTMVQRGNTVVLLDEINRLEPYLHNSLMPLLDETRETSIHGEHITVGPNVIFFCTMNVGAGFVGTFLLDSAVKNRMDATIMMPKLSIDREIQLLVERTGIDNGMAKTIVNKLERIRNAALKNEIDIDVSPRSSLKLARVMTTGHLEIDEALTLIVFNNAESSEQAKLLVDSLIGG